MFQPNAVKQKTGERHVLYKRQGNWIWQRAVYSLIVLLSVQAEMKVHCKHIVL